MTQITLPKYLKHLKENNDFRLPQKGLKLCSSTLETKASTSIF